MKPSAWIAIIGVAVVIIIASSGWAYKQGNQISRHDVKITNNEKNIEEIKDIRKEIKDIRKDFRKDITEIKGALIEQSTILKHIAKKQRER